MVLSLYYSYISSTSSTLTVSNAPSISNVSYQVQATNGGSTTVAFNTDNRGTGTVTVDASMFTPQTLPAVAYTFSPSSSFTLVPTITTDYDSKSNINYTTVPFLLNATSESTGTFSYSSIYPSVATIDLTGNVTLLTAGNAVFTINQTADRSFGDGYKSVALTIDATAPSAPTGVTATAGTGNGQASVSWTVPASNGGDPGMSYTVTSSPGSFTATIFGATTTTVTSLTNGQPYTFTVTATNSGGTSSASVSSNSVKPSALPSCVGENTTVLTPNGYVNVAKLKVGDCVVTDDNRHVKIKKVFVSTAYGNKYYPYIVEKNSIGENYPVEDISLSPDHLIKYNDSWLLSSRLLSSRITTKRDNSKEAIKYYNLLLENYATDNIVINNGTVVESYAPGPDIPLRQKRRNNKN